MKAITLRNVPGPVARAIWQKAKRERLSLNRAVVELLKEATGRAAGEAVGTRRSLSYELDKYAGSWTKRQAAEFNAALRAQRAVNPKDSQ